MAITFRNDEEFVVDYGLVDIVRDWAWADDDEGYDPIRIDAVRKYVEDTWRLQWSRRADIVKAFRAVKEKHREDIRAAAGVDSRYGVRLFTFGELP